MLPLVLTACTVSPGTKSTHVDAHVVVQSQDAIDAALGGQSDPSDAGILESDAETRGESDAANVQRLPLLDHTQWATFDAPLDPLPGHQPASIQCNIAGWYVERYALEISTADCNYPLLQHPSLVSLAKGSTVRLVFGHFDLTASEPAQAHVALLFGDDLQWETTVEIPQAGQVYSAQFRTTRALVAGEPIRWHVHNHGQNMWWLTSLVAELSSP